MDENRSKMLPISIRSIPLKTAALLALTTLTLLAPIASAQPPLQQTSTASSTDPFTLTIAGRPAVDVGGTANLVVTIAPQSISIEPVKLACSGLPAESTCSFGEPMLPVNGGTTNLQITTTAPHDYGSTEPYFQSAIKPFAGPALAGLIMLSFPRRKRNSLKGSLTVLIALCGLATLGTLTGCGNSTDLGTRPGDYTISIIGTSTELAATVVTTKFVLHVAVP